MQRSQKHQKDSQDHQLFALLVSALIKAAACKHVHEIDPRLVLKEKDTVIERSKSVKSKFENINQL